MESAMNALAEFSGHIKSVDIGVKNHGQQGGVGSESEIHVAIGLHYKQGLAAFLLLNEQTGLLSDYEGLLDWTGQEFYPRKSPASKTFSIQRTLATLTKAGCLPDIRVELFWRGDRLLKVSCRDLSRARQHIKSGGLPGVGS